MLVIGAHDGEKDSLKNCFQKSFSLYFAESIKEADGISLSFGTDSGVRIILIGSDFPAEMINELHKYNKLNDIPVISLTDSAEKESAAFENGATDILSLPLNPITANTRINNIAFSYCSGTHSELKAENERYIFMQRFSRTIICERNINTGMWYYSGNISDYFEGTYNNSTSILPEWAKNNVTRDEDRTPLNAFINAALRTEQINTADSFLVQLKTKQKGFLWYKLTVSASLDERTGEHRVFLTINNVNDDIVFRQKYDNNTRTIEMISRNMSAGLKVVNIDEAFSFHYVSDSLCKLLGYTHAEFIKMSGGTASGAVYPPDFRVATKTADRLFYENGEYRCEYRMVKKTGELMWVSDIGQKFIDIDGVERISSVITDITAFRSAMETLRYQAEYDSLTGIYNKDTFIKKAGEFITANTQIDFVIIVLDVEQFKVVNDQYGLITGDNLLCHIADQLQQILQIYGGLAGRVSADIFTLCVPVGYDRTEHIIHDITTRIRSFPLEYEINIAFGIYDVVSTDVPVNLMVDRASIACQKVKGNYINHCALFRDEMRSTILAEQEIVRDMRSALEQRQFVIFCQPQFNHANGKIIGGEVLVRWNHPHKGLIPPDRFIGIFEKNGFITKLDEFIWEQACIQLRSILDTTEKPIPLAVNISRVDIYNPSLIKILLDLINKYDIPIQLLKLEITETAYTENADQLIDTVKKLQSYGFTVEMDDFGSGYSSLNSLKDVPVDVLKIDLKFLSDKGRTGRGGNILNSIVRLAKWLDLDVIAEGVETQAQADFLKSIGCTAVQGFLYSRPLPMTEFMELLRNSEADLLENTSPRRILVNLNDFWNPESSLTHAFNMSLVAAAVVDFSGNSLEVMRVNDKFLRLFCVSREDFTTLSKKMDVLIVPDDYEKMIKQLSEASKTLMDFECEFRVNNRNLSDVFRAIKASFTLVAHSETSSVFYCCFEDFSQLRGLENELETMSSLTDNLFNNIPVGVAVAELRKKPKMLFINSAMSEIVGYTKEQINNATEETFFENISVPCEGFRKLAHTDKDVTLQTECAVKKPDGATVTINVSAYIKQCGINPPLCYSIVSDVTESYQNEQMLRLVVERYRILAERLNSLTLDYDIVKDEIHYTVKPSGKPLEQHHLKNYLSDMDNSETLSPETLDAYRSVLTEVMKDGIDRSVEYKASVFGRGYTWCRAHFFGLSDIYGQVYRIIGRVDDIDEDKQKLEQANAAADKDLLSGLLNHMTAKRLIKKELEENKAAAVHALVMIDIDDFKGINDRFGHIAGDSAIKSIADTLTDVFGNCGITGRFGGDEFIILIGYTDKDAPEKLPECFLERVRNLDCNGIRLTCSIGVAIQSEELNDYSSLLSAADKALYAAKSAGKNRMEIFRAAPHA